MRKSTAEQASALRYRFPSSGKCRSFRPITELGLLIFISSAKAPHPPRSLILTAYAKEMDTSSRSGAEPSSRGRGAAPPGDAREGTKIGTKRSVGGRVGSAVGCRCGLGSVTASRIFLSQERYRPPSNNPPRDTEIALQRASPKVWVSVFRSLFIVFHCISLYCALSLFGSALFIVLHGFGVSGCLRSRSKN